MNMDVLAHCPTSYLSDQTIELWSSRTIIPTLHAFGGSSTAVDNLRRFHMRQEQRFSMVQILGMTTK